MKLKVILSLILLVLCVGIVQAQPPTKVWEENSPLGTNGNVYYGNVVDDVYYVGQIDSGVLSYSMSQTGSPALQNSYQTGSGASKSAVKIGEYVYYSLNSGGVVRLDGWMNPAAMAIDAGAPEAFATDGTFLYSNDYNGTGKNPVRKYSISGTNLATVWSATLTDANRVRGISYYSGDGGKVYAVDGVNGVWEINASDGSGATKIISWSGITGYQAVRHGSAIYVVADNGNLYQYYLISGTWILVETDNLGIGASLYGIGMNSTGTGFWASSVDKKTAFFKVPDTGYVGTVSDTFTRDDSTNLGTTEIPGGQYPWVRAADESNVSISNGQLYFANGSSNSWNAVGVSLGGNYQPADFDMSFKITMDVSAGWGSGVEYRYPYAGFYNGAGEHGYFVYASSDGYLSLISHGVWNQVKLDPVPDWSVPHILRIKATGDHHEIWLDGVKTHDVIDSDKLSGGYINFIRLTTPTMIDDLTIQAAGCTSSIGGIVKDSVTEVPITGAKVTLGNNMLSATTGSDGKYSFTGLSAGTYTVKALADGYSYTSNPVTVDENSNDTLDISLDPLTMVDGVKDTFTRAAGTDLGTTELPCVQYPWILGASETAASITADGKLLLDTGIDNSGVSIGGGFQPADFDMSVDITLDVNNGWGAGIGYRTPAPGRYMQSDNPYFVYCSSDGRLCLISYGVWNQVQLDPVPDWSIPHILRIRAIGPHHEIWLDGVKTHDLLDFSKLSGGYINFLRLLSTATFDNLDIKVSDLEAPLMFSPDGGNSALPINVTISSPVSNTTIRYTTDGTDPTVSSKLYDGPVVIPPTYTVLKARAFKAGTIPCAVKSATYNTFSRPAAITYGSGISIDGNLSDWNGAEWVPLDKTYDGSPTDISEAYYAAKWGDNGNKVYVAVKVKDTAPHFTNTYTAWNARDAVELYIHTTGNGPTNYLNTQADAQQYAIGITADNPNQVWTDIGENNAVPAGAGFQAAGKVDGGWIYYEAAITPFKSFSLTGAGNVVSTLKPGDVLGLDVVAVGYASAYTGVKSENNMTGKSENYLAIAQHAIAVAPGDLVNTKNTADNAQASITGAVVTAVFPGYFYIENTNRTCGIRVETSGKLPAVNSTVSVSGFMKTLESGERCISAWSVASAGTGTVAPLGLTNKALGGGDFMQQQGVTNATGLNNIGLLVKAWGRATALGGGRYSLSDGSGEDVTVKLFSGTIADGSYVSVTGISSSELAGNDVKRLLLVNSINDVVPYQ